MVQIWLHHEDRGAETLPYPVEVAPYLQNAHEILWVDAENPTEEELAWIQGQFRIHPIAMEDYNTPKERARIDRYEDFYSIVLHALTFQKEECELVERPLTLFVGQSFLVTLHADPFPEIEEARKLWVRHEEMRESEVGIALYSLFDVIIDDYFPIIDRLADEVEDVEDQVLQEGRPADLDQIFHLKRQLINVRRAVSPERDVLNVLMRRELPIISEPLMIYFQDLYDHMVRIQDGIDTHRELLAGAIDLYVSVASNRMAKSANRLNETMQTLAAWSIILMSASLIAGIYGMNFERMPELKWVHGYPGALAFMLALAGILAVYFKRRKWL